MDHRRTPSNKAYVPASWFIVLTVMLCVGAAGWLGWLFVDGDAVGTEVASPSPTATTATTPSPTATTPEPTRTTKTTPKPKPKPTPTKKKTKTAEPVEVARNPGVSVLNNTTIQGLASTYSAKVRAAGWVDVSVGNWRGSIAGNTVYYPPALAAQGNLLARDVGIGRIMPSIAPMRTDRLTIILAGPQQ